MAEMMLHLYGGVMRKIVSILCLLMICGYSYADKKFDPSGLMCKENGARKSVWINTSHGTYALNGQAMTWFNNTKKMGVPLLGTDGKEWKTGRDHVDPSTLHSLIKKGLKKCN
jgi:hypothetical protein